MQSNGAIHATVPQALRVDDNTPGVANSAAPRRTFRSADTASAPAGSAPATATAAPDKAPAIGGKATYTNGFGSHSVPLTDGDADGASSVSASDAPSASGAPDGLPQQQEQHPPIEMIIEAVSNGTHEEIVRLARALQAAKDRRVALADRVRKMHVQIADNMYDYELQEAAAAYERALADAKERTRNEILAAHIEQERIMQHFQTVGAAHRALLPPSTMRTRRAAEVAAAACLAEYAADGHIQPHSSSQGGPSGGRKRSSGGASGGAGSCSAAAAAAAKGDPMAALALALGDDAVRADLVSIVRDMENRAQKVFETSVKKHLPEVFATFGVLMICDDPKAAPRAAAPDATKGAAAAGAAGVTERPISPLSTDGRAPTPESVGGPPSSSSVDGRAGGDEDETSGATQQRSQRIVVGSFVCLHSFFSDEDFVGIVSSITPEEVIVKLGTGTRLRVYVEQIRERRVTIRLDEEMERDMEVLSAAKRSRLVL